MDSETATKLDAFWGKLSLEHRAALQTVFNLGFKREPMKGSAEILRNAESGRRTINSISGTMIRFLEARVNKCTDAEAVMTMILEYGKLSPEEQEAKLHDSGE
jgi:predicted RNA binding protein YcfA (HicA-like mRNA interferase family)